MADKPKRKDVSVKIDAAVYRKAKMVATYRGVHIAEYLTELLSKPVQRDYDKMRENMGQDEPAADEP